MNFCYIPIDSATADRFRQTAINDGGNYAALMIFILFSGREWLSAQTRVGESPQ
jgi:hypothetical protein